MTEDNNPHSITKAESVPVPEEFKEANLDTEPEKVIKQESDLLWQKATNKFKTEYLYHWNRLLVASSKIQKKEPSK